MSFAPGLFELLAASTPPSVSYFKSLPTNAMKEWAVYLIVMEKAGFRPKIYVGAGTQVIRGVSVRLQHYNNLTIPRTPRLVRQAAEDGFAIVHRGFLCSMDIPSTAQAPRLRALFFLLEATFTFCFWALNCHTEYGFGGAWLWLGFI